MPSKARLFDDNTALSAILAPDEPRDQKRLRRQIRPRDITLWQKYCEDIVLQVNLAKFSQNEEMRFALDNTGVPRLAEVNPNDKVWGIGLSACDLHGVDTTHRDWPYSVPKIAPSRNPHAPR